jgi:hypothetical protein
LDDQNDLLKAELLNIHNLENTRLDYKVDEPDEAD